MVFMSMKHYKTNTVGGKRKKERGEKGGEGGKSGKNRKHKP